MALVTAQSITGSAITPVLAAVNATDTVAADQGLFLWVNNGSGAPITVTLTDAGLTSAGSAATNPSFSVTNGQARAVALNVGLANATTGLITIGYSAITTVTAGVFRR